MKPEKKPEIISFALKLKKVREEAGMSQKDFAEKIGIGPVTMNRLEKGNQSPDASLLIELRKLFGIDLNWILSEDSSSDSINASRSLPVFDDAQLILADEQRRQDKTIQFPNQDEGDFAYRVKDESMAPVVRTGDYVIVMKQDPQLGELTLCQLQNGVVQVRRVSSSDNKLVVSPGLPEYGQPIGMGEVKIHGKVLQIIRLHDVS